MKADVAHEVNPPLLEPASASCGRLFSNSSIGISSGSICGVDAVVEDEEGVGADEEEEEGSGSVLVERFRRCVFMNEAALEKAWVASEDAIPDFRRDEDAEGEGEGSRDDMVGWLGQVLAGCGGDEEGGVGDVQEDASNS